MLALIVFNFFVAPIIQMAISRAREYAADATGALITRNPRALASALQKISSDARVEILDGKKTMVQLVDAICALMEEKGLEGLSTSGYLSTDLAMPIRQEIFACFNRYRGLKL